MTLGTTENVDGLPEPVARSVIGEHCQIQWSVSMQPKLQKAMERAIDKAGEGDALANAAVYRETQYWVLLYRNSIRVEGDVVSVDRVSSEGT